MCAHKMFKVGRQWGAMWWLEESFSQKTVSQAKHPIIFENYQPNRCTIVKTKRDWLSESPKLMCGSLFLFACGEGVRVVSRGVSDTCHVSHVSPWVTTSPLPSTHVGVRDMWETTSIYGSQWQMGLGTGRAYGQKLEIPEMCDLVK